MQVKKQQLELNMDNPACLTYMQSTSCEMLDWIKLKLESRLQLDSAIVKILSRNINNLRYADNATLMAESEEELKSLLMKVKESEKAA